MRAPLLALLLAACQPDGPGFGEVCLELPPAPGAVVVRELVCSAEVPAAGDGRGGADVLLANTRFRAVIRSPEESLTLLRVGGGTLLDAAPWEVTDALYEVVPIVGGGWLDVDAFEVTDDGVRVGGTVVDLPDRPAEGAGTRREITWRIAPDDPWIQADGADGLWVHPLPGAGVFTGGVLHTAGALQAAPQPAAIEDLGGALRIDGADRWLVGGAGDWGELGPTQHVSGTVLVDGVPAEGGVRMLAAGAVIGRHTVEEDGSFDLEIPAQVDALVGEVGGRLDGPAVAPGDGLALETLPPAILRVVPVWDGIDPRELPLAFSATGPTRRLLVGPDGRDVLLSPGAWDLELGEVPSLAPATTRVDVAAGAVTEVALRPTRAWDPGERVLATFGVLGEGSWQFRGSDGGVLSGGAIDGLGFVVVAPPDSVGRASDGDESLRLGWRNGTLAVHPDGWSILAWPWSANEKFAGFGAPDLAGVDPATALSITAGPSGGRFAAVDLAWLAVAGSPYDHRLTPAFVRLEDPGPAGPAAWAGWWAWLDAGRPVVPIGPSTWVEVLDAGLYGATEVEDGLANGRVSAGSGPVVLVRWGDASAGEVHDDAPFDPALPARVEVRGGGTVDRMALVGEGGVLLAEWSPAGDAVFLPRPAADPGAWVTAVAWTEGGGDWAVAGPIWLDPPGR